MKKGATVHFGDEWEEEDVETKGLVALPVVVDCRLAAFYSILLGTASGVMVGAVV